MKLLSKRYLFSSHNEKDLYYQRLVVKSNLQNSYLALTQSHPEVKETYKDIIYKDLRWGSSPRDVISKLDTPRYKVEALNDLQEHLVLFFKRDILNQKTIVQCHFLENQLYFIHIDFLSSLSNELTFINDLIYKKYILNDKGSRRNTCIKDGDQNKLIINTDVTLSLSYVSGIPSIILSLEKQIHNQTALHKDEFDYSLLEL